jgi:hypothetical protein
MQVPTNGRRTRGANCTSADAAVRFEREDGATQIALIEWKYAESCPRASFVTPKRGTSRSDLTPGTRLARQRYRQPRRPVTAGRNRACRRRPCRT